MSQYKILSQSESVNEAENLRISIPNTSDECASLASSQDSLDLALLQIKGGERPKRKVRRKRRPKMGGGIHSFEGAESYEVIDIRHRTGLCLCHVTL